MGCPRLTHSEENEAPDWQVWVAENPEKETKGCIDAQNGGGDDGSCPKCAWEAFVQWFVPFGDDIYPREDDGTIYSTLPDLPIGPGGAVKVVKLAKNAKKVVVIGEDMAKKVIPYAEKIGATWFKPTSTNPANWMRNQAQWIRRQIKDPFTTIIDVGPKGASPSSKYYMKELEMLKKWLGY